MVWRRFFLSILIFHRSPILSVKSWKTQKISLQLFQKALALVFTCASCVSSVMFFDLMRQFHGIWCFTWKTYRMSSLLSFLTRWKLSTHHRSIFNVQMFKMPSHLGAKTMWQQPAAATSNWKETLTKMYSINKREIYGQSFRARIYWFCSITFDVFFYPLDFPVFWYLFSALLLLFVVWFLLQHHSSLL